MTPELSQAYADVTRLERRVREMEAALQEIADFDQHEDAYGDWHTYVSLESQLARSALAKREGG